MDTTVCIPTLNEEESIDAVVSDVRDAGYVPLVIDGGSTDDTVRLARENGANVVEQKISGGKGAAVVQAMRDVDSEVLVLIDGDTTYEPKHIPQLVKPIREGNYDHIIANRFHNIEDGAMSVSHRIGNYVANMSFRVLFNRYLHDILSGFRSLRLSEFDQEEIQSRGFDIETELCAYSVMQNHEIGVVGTDYYERNGESKLKSATDSLRIYRRMAKLRFGGV